MTGERSGERVGERVGQGGFSVCEGKLVEDKGQAYRKQWVADLSVWVAAGVVVKKSGCRCVEKSGGFVAGFRGTRMRDHKEDIHSLPFSSLKPQQRSQSDDGGRCEDM